MLDNVIGYSLSASLQISPISSIVNDLSFGCADNSNLVINRLNKLLV